MVPSLVNSLPTTDRAMFSSTASTPTTPLRATACAAAIPGSPDKAPDATRRIGEALSLVQQALAPQRQLVREGDVICEAGQRFDCLYVLNSGCCKVVTLAGDGREQVVAWKFRGDWLGFDGIATGRYVCGTMAIDTGEVWVVSYQALLDACASQPALLALVHGAMSREISQERDSLMSVCTLPADARVAEFLRSWAASLRERGLRTDQITLPLSRAEIGNYLGLTLETVSRSLSKLARHNLIGFAERRRRDMQIPDVDALGAFVQRCLAPTLQ